MFENSTHTLDMFDNLIRLRQDGVVDVVERTARGHALAGLGEAGSWTVGAFHADSDEAVHSHLWERHPNGHEVLCLLSGTMRVQLRDQGDGRSPVATLTSGRSFVVPAGRWHRPAVVEPGDLLSITPRTDTQHQKVGPAEGGRS